MSPPDEELAQESAELLDVLRDGDRVRCARAGHYVPAGALGILLQTTLPEPRTRRMCIVLWDEYGQRFCEKRQLELVL